MLKTRKGLEPSPLKGYMVYTAAEGDTWSGLAERFYQGGAFATLLQTANEDLANPASGRMLLVPVFDFRTIPTGRAPREPAPGHQPEDPAAEPQRYEVVDGDSLWKIADKVYGSGARWMEIYQANRDVMAEPDSLTLGLVLRIP